jgi:hypothetical protein
MLGLLAAGFVTACSPARRGEDGVSSGRDSSTSSTVPPTTTTTTTAAPVPLPADGEPPFDRVNPMSGFIAFGDSGGGADQAAVAEAMRRWTDDHRVDALVTTGDNVYDFGEPHLFEAQLITPYRALREGGRPLWAVLGNHDVMRGHGAEQMAFLGLPPLPYEQRLPGVRILFLDGNRPGDAAQKQWLADRLAEPAPPLFTVAVFHQPVFSCGIHGRTETVIKAWYDLLNSGRVSLVLTGHDHQYQRFLTAEGTTFIVTGGGGRNLYRLIPGCSAPEMRAGVVKHHFTGIEIYSDRLALTAVTPDGTVIDQIEIPAALVP